MLVIDKIILINKYTSSQFFWENLIKRNNFTNLSVEAIINKYDGFEGELIALSFINEDFIDLSEILDTRLELNNKKNSLILYINSHNDKPQNLDKLFSQVGYDCGICEEEKTIYSSIFNEILFGIVKELVCYKSKLNEHFLFPNRNLAKEYTQLRQHLLREGKDVENEQMLIYEIWKYKT